MQPLSQKSQGNDYCFRVSHAVILVVDSCLPIKITRPIKRQGSQLGVLFALYRVEVDFHDFIVTTIKQIVKDKYPMISFLVSSNRKQRGFQEKLCHADSEDRSLSREGGMSGRAGLVKQDRCISGKAAL